MIPAFRPSVGDEELEAIRGVLASGWLGMGEVTRRFEAAVSEKIGGVEVVAVDKGTSALHLALDVLDLAPGDEVIVPSLTFVASIQAVLIAGATPVFCEVRPETLNLDLDDVADRIGPRTRVVMPVHFAGEPCDIDALRQVVGSRSITIVEDAAHAFGSFVGDRPVGTLGDLTCFSFDAIKNITCGEGGAITTDRSELIDTLRTRRCLGIDRDGWARQQTERNWQYRVVSRGFRYHMSDVNAAIGLAQLDKMERFRKRKRAIARRYDTAFGGRAEVSTLRRSAGTFPFAYVLRVHDGRRDGLIAALRAEGIATMVQFTPNHLQPAFEAWRTPLPVTESLFEEIVSLPFTVELSDRDVDRVIECVTSFLDTPAAATVAVIRDTVAAAPGKAARS